MNPTPQEFAQRDRLLAGLGLQPPGADAAENGPAVPFHFSVEGGDATANMADGWVREIKGGEDHYTVVWRHPGLRLQVAVEVRRFTGAPAFDYVCRVRNEGECDSPLLSNILPLRLQIEADETTPVRVHYAHGSMCNLDDFLPQTSTVPLAGDRQFTPNGGRSSDGVLPFFNVELRNGGLMLAVGWSGQWQVAVKRERFGNVAVAAGMAKTHLRLRPGESIRTPRILLLAWEGADRFRGHNLLRRLLLQSYVPKLNGQPVTAPIAHNTAAAACLRMASGGENANERNQLAAIARCAELGMEAYWLDAYWYPYPWSTNVGNWFPRPEDFPRGLKPLADAAHERGLKFVLWYEPERVRRGSRLAKEHPEFMLELDGVDNMLFNLGDPAALAYMTDFLSGEIARYGIDVYRQDFNIRPLAYWETNDSPDRVGVSEVRYIEGLYGLWGELLRRHPRLVIDNCASGGRRIDLETLSLSIPLWRTDYTDAAYSQVEPGSRRLNAPVADQVQTAGLNLFLPPVHTGPVGRCDPYGFRSAMSTGAVIYGDITADGFPDETLKAGLAELRRLRPYLLGDFYPLTEISTDSRTWCAYQYHRPEHGDGIALYFRRRDAEPSTHPALLREVGPSARYEVSFSGTYDPGKTSTLSGVALKEFEVVAREKPSAVLLQYRELR